MQLPYLGDVDGERAWLATVLALVVALVGGSILFFRRVYVEFVWQYFWGPVYADAHGATCAAWAGGRQDLYYRLEFCRNAVGPVAYPGYTLVSEVGYMLVLLLAIGGVVLLLNRLRVGDDRRFFYGLLPFMFLGGALRVVEDANDAVPEGAGAVVSYPWNTLLISPVIYVTLFVLALASLVVAVWAARSGVLDRGYEYALAALGTVFLVATLAYLLYLSFTRDYVGFHPLVTVATLVVATLATLATALVVRRFWPEVNSGTGVMGGVVVWGHAVDGASNVLVLDFATAFGLSDYAPKHPVNQAIVEWTSRFLPEAVTQVTGTAWPFLLVKLVAATVAVWLFNDEIFEEHPRYAVLMLVAVLAVGLGPGTRDMLRATLGI